MPLDQWELRRQGRYGGGVEEVGGEITLTLKGRGYFTNEKDGLEGHYGPFIYLGS